MKIWKNLKIYWVVDLQLKYNMKIWKNLKIYWVVDLLSNVLACMLSHFSCVWLFVTPWAVACQASLSMECSKQEYWSGLPCLPSGDLPHSGIESESHVSSSRQEFYHSIPPGKPRVSCHEKKKKKDMLKKKKLKNKTWVPWLHSG